MQFTPSAAHIYQHHNGVQYYRLNLPFGDTYRSLRLSLGTRCPEEAHALAGLVGYHVWMDKPAPEITYTELKQKLQNLIHKLVKEHKARLALSGPHAVPPPDIDTLLEHLSLHPDLAEKVTKSAGLPPNAKSQVQKELPAFYRALDQLLKDANDKAATYSTEMPELSSEP